MNRDPRINAMLESFRPGVDDLADPVWAELRAPLVSQPELQRQAEAIQKKDDVIRSAMHDVAVPAGLAERLLANLSKGPAAATTEEAPANEAPAEEAPVVEPVSLPAAQAAPTRSSEGARFSRRAWFSGSIAAAAAIALAVVLWPKGPTDSGAGTEEDVVQLVAAWESDTTLTGQEWEPLSNATGLSSHPIHAGDLMAQVRGVMGPVTRGEGHTVAVYELVGAGGQTARLYVAHTNRKFAVPSSPQSPLPGLTGARGGVAWQRGQYLYVAIFKAGDSGFVRMRDFT